MSVMGGPLTPVKVLTAADLAENGGVYRLAHVPARPVYRLDGSGRAVTGGRAVAVYVVDANYARGFYGGAAEPLYILPDDVPMPLRGDEVIPVYLAAGSAAIEEEEEEVPAGHWWTDTGIPAGQFIAVYQAKGAASQNASYVNLANPAIHPLVAGGTGPLDWGADYGWHFVWPGGNPYPELHTDINPSPTTRIFIQVTGITRDAVYRYLLGASQTGVATVGVAAATVQTGFRFGPTTDTAAYNAWNGSGPKNIGIGPGAYYMDGVKTVAPQMSGLASELPYPIWLAMRNTNGAANLLVWEMTVTSLVFLDGAPSDAQALALSAAMAAL